MTRITENTIGLLEKLGYSYIYAPDVAPDSENPERESFMQLISVGRLLNLISLTNKVVFNF
jgi:type I restriction enzyme R subunit